MDKNNSDQSESWSKESRQIQRIASYGFLLNLALTIMKIALAFVSGSLAITASTIDSATDSISSLLLYFGLKLSTKKTSNFPLGLYKIENVISVILALFIFFAGYEIARHAFFTEASFPEISLTTILLMLAGTIAIFFFGQYAIAAGKKTESPTLIAEGRHRQADFLSSIVVLLSISINYFNMNIDLYGITVDQVAAVVVLFFIAHTGWELLSDGMRVLLDASVDHETLGEVKKIIESEPLVSEVRSLVGRSAGRFRFLQASVTMRTGDLEKAHEISSKIENNIMERIPHVERVTIHYEPQVRKYVNVAVPLSDTDGTLSAHFGDAPYFALLRLRTDGYEIESREIVENPYTSLEKGKGIRVAEWLVEKSIDRVALSEDVKSKGASYVFSDAGIKILTVSETNLNGVLKVIKASAG
jgi:cation diffusion facilitator family transporter